MPDGKDAKLMIRLPQELLEAAREKSRQVDIPISQYVRRCLWHWVSEEPSDLVQGGNILLEYAQERVRRAEQIVQQNLLDRVRNEGWNPTVHIRRQWNDWRVGSVPFDELDGLQWDDQSGRIQQRAPQPFIHGYVWCTDMESGAGVS